MKKTYNFSLLILLTSVLSTATLLSENPQNPNGPGKEDITEIQEHLDKLREAKESSQQDPHGDILQRGKIVSDNRSWLGKLKDGAQIVAADAGIDYVVQDPTLFQSFPVEVRKLMIERHPHIMIPLIMEHPGLIRQVPARKILKDILYAVWYQKNPN